MQPSRSRTVRIGSIRSFSTVRRACSSLSRLRVLRLLLGGECCVSAIARESHEELSTVSQRLKLLRLHGLVDRRRQGRHIIYSLVDGHVAELVRSGLAHAAEAS